MMCSIASRICSKQDLSDKITTTIFVECRRLLGVIFTQQIVHTAIKANFTFSKAKIYK